VRMSAKANSMQTHFTVVEANKQLDSDLFQGPPDAYMADASSKPLFAPVGLSLMRSSLPAGAKCLYARLLLWCGKRKRWRGTAQLLADALGCSVAIVRDHLETLRKRDLISWTQQGQVSIYRIVEMLDSENEAQFGQLRLDILEVPIKRLPFGSKVLHCALSYFDRHGACFPSQAKLAEFVGCSARNVRNLLQPLKDLGLVEVGRRWNKSSYYTLIALADCQDSSASEWEDPSPSTVRILPPKKGIKKGVLRQASDCDLQAPNRKKHDSSPACAHAPIPYQIQPTEKEEEWRNSKAIKMVERLFGERVRTRRFYDDLVRAGKGLSDKEIADLLESRWLWAQRKEKTRPRSLQWCIQVVTNDVQERRNASLPPAATKTYERDPKFDEWDDLLGPAA
jgi:biotin operon repressor